MVSSKHHDLVAEFPEKKRFSMIDERVSVHLAQYPTRKMAVLYGCETHICVKQTALDLLATGYSVHVVVDAVTSMGVADRNVGLAALQDSGARLTTF